MTPLATWATFAAVVVVLAAWCAACAWVARELDHLRESRRDARAAARYRSTLNRPCEVRVTRHHPRSAR